MATKLYTKEYWLNKIDKARTPAQKRNVVKQFEKWENKNKMYGDVEKELNKIKNKLKKS